MLVAGGGQGFSPVTEQSRRGHTGTRPCELRGTEQSRGARTPHRGPEAGRSPGRSRSRPLLDLDSGLRSPKGEGEGTSVVEPSRLVSPCSGHLGQQSPSSGQEWAGCGRTPRHRVCGAACREGARAWPRPPPDLEPCLGGVGQHGGLPSDRQPGSPSLPSSQRKPPASVSRAQETPDPHVSL